SGIVNLPELCLLQKQSVPLRLQQIRKAPGKSLRRKKLELPKGLPLGQFRVPAKLVPGSFQFQNHARGVLEGFPLSIRCRCQRLGQSEGGKLSRMTQHQKVLQWAAAGSFWCPRPD